MGGEATLSHDGELMLPPWLSFAELKAAATVLCRATCPARHCSECSPGYGTLELTRDMLIAADEAYARSKLERTPFDLPEPLPKPKSAPAKSRKRRKAKLAKKAR
jgi:hypothetical protein